MQTHLLTTAPIHPGSNWTDMAFTGMESNGLAASVYFVVWLLLGHFVLVTLFLAILITNCQYEENVPLDSTLDNNSDDKPPWADDTSTASSATDAYRSTHGVRSVQIVTVGTWL